MIREVERSEYLRKGQERRSRGRPCPEISCLVRHIGKMNLTLIANKKNKIRVKKRNPSKLRERKGC